MLSRIRHTRHIMPNYVKRDVSTALIDPILSYDDVITYGWGAHGSINQENRILIADNDKLRYIFSLKRNDHISEYRKQINGLTPESRAKLNSATLIYKQLKHQTPTYLNDMFVRNINSTRSNGKLRVLVKPHSEFDKRAFGFAGINFWNSIPDEIKQQESVESFKFHLKHWLRSIQ